MAKNNHIKIIMITILAVIMGIQVAFSSPGLNVVLANQNPDPVSPGNFVEVNIKVANSGENSIEYAKIRMIENENFRIVQGRNNMRDLGVIPPFSTLPGSRSFVIAKYSIEVSPNTPLGLNPIQFQVETPGGTYFYDFYISIQEKNPTIQINSISVDTIEAGKSSKLSIEIQNRNSISLRNVIVNLDLASVDSRVLSMVSGSNQKLIPSMRPNEITTLEFEIAASPDAVAKPYLLPININFEDSFENSYSTSAIGSVRVYSPPLISLRLDSQDIYSEGKGRLSFAISNPGTSSIKGTQIEILNSPDYEVIDGKYQYIGDLNPDDFQTMQTQVFLYGNENTKINMKITYLDSYNVKNEEILEIPVTMYSREELEKFGIVSARQGFSVFGYILVLLIAIGAFIIGRKIGYKKAKKKLNK